MRKQLNLTTVGQFTSFTPLTYWLEFTVRAAKDFILVGHQ